MDLVRQLQIAFLKRHGWYRCGSQGWKNDQGRVFTLETAVAFQMIENAEKKRKRKQR